LYLGAEPGSMEGAKRILAATDLHAAAYRAWLEKQRGEKPRIRSSEKASATSDLTTSSGRPKKKSGLEHTLSNATIAKKFAALRRMYRVLIAHDLGITKNPFDTDVVPPPPKDVGRKRPTEMIDFERVTEILSLPDVSTPKGLRDKAMLSILFAAGLRRSEVTALRVADFRTTPSGAPFLYLRATKAKRDASQALAPWAAEAVQALVEQRRRDGAGDGDFLFISYVGRGGATATNEPVSDSGLYKLFKAYGARAGVEAHVSPHSARATAITKLLEQGLSHREVQEFSRHSSVQMVEAYDKRRLQIEQNPARVLSYGGGHKGQRNGE
jgi:site-specific recombinase XerD